MARVPPEVVSTGCASILCVGRAGRFTDSNSGFVSPPGLATWKTQDVSNNDKNNNNNYVYTDTYDSRPLHLTTLRLTTPHHTYNPHTPRSSYRQCCCETLVSNTYIFLHISQLSPSVLL